VGPTAKLYRCACGTRTVTNNIGFLQETVGDYSELEVGYVQMADGGRRISVVSRMNIREMANVAEQKAIAEVQRIAMATAYVGELDRRDDIRKIGRAKLPEDEAQDVVHDVILKGATFPLTTEDLLVPTMLIMGVPIDEEGIEHFAEYVRAYAPKMRRIQPWRFVTPMFEMD
jgi:hypothetical protein